MSSQPQIIRSIITLRKKVQSWHREEKTVALVPTMGALHEGHLSLVKLAKKKCDHVIVSIFVNPTQFGPNEDFSKYPRTEKSDQTKLTGSGTDIIFAPKAEQIYPADFATTVSVTGLTDILCGASRPGHFDGVATIVTKLLLQGLPDIAVFGEKDYQQLLVIKRFTEDLNIPVKIVGAPLLREADGLALSSRNAYLSESDRKIAPKLYQTLQDLKNKLQSGKSVKPSLSAAKRKLSSLGFQIDYLEIRDTKNLQIMEKTVDQPARIFVAAYLGNTRLIDNIALRAKK